MKSIAILHRFALALAIATLLCATGAAEDGSGKAAASPGREAFEILKGLAGEWTGQMGEGAARQAVSAIYKVTSNGTVVMETLFPGSPHEMVTVYYLEGDKLVLVHYCAAGNQPKMTLVKSSAKKLEFDYAGGSNVKVETDAHMHALNLTLESQDVLTAAWDYYKGGRKVDVTRFTLKRKPA